MPVTVQTAAVWVESVTVKPDEADGLKTTVGVCIDCGPGSGIVIVCGAFEIVKVRVIGVAAL